MNSSLVFMKIDPIQQIEELRAYLQSVGGEFKADSTGNLVTDLLATIDVCDAVFSDNPDQVATLESVLNTISSLIQSVDLPADHEKLVIALSKKLCDVKTCIFNDTVSLRIMWSMYISLEERSLLRLQVYYYLVLLAGRSNEIDLIFKGIDEFNAQLDDVSPPPPMDQQRSVLRELHRALLHHRPPRSEAAAHVMIKLLSTYSADNASDAKDEAQRCIVASLADPNTFLFDHLLALQPVSFLEGELVHDLLKIFVNGNLTTYQQFYTAHKDFVDSTLGLDHATCLAKMKLLTFMQLMEDRTEITFAEICQEMQIERDQVEQFVLDLLKTPLVTAKINQTAETVTVSSTMHRTFGSADWTHLQSLLTAWRNELYAVQSSLSQIAERQRENEVERRREERSNLRHVHKLATQSASG